MILGSNLSCNTLNFYINLKNILRGGHPAEILHGRDRQFATHYKCNFVLNTWNHASIFRILDKQ